MILTHFKLDFNKKKVFGLNTKSDTRRLFSNQKKKKKKMENKNAMESYFKSLKDAINNGNTSEIEKFENKLSESLSDFIKISGFQNLPFENLCNILKKMNYIGLQNPAMTLTDLLTPIIAVYKEKAISILNLINAKDLRVAIPDIVQILSCFTTSSLCTLLDELYKEEDTLLTRDYDYEIQTLQQKLEETQQKAQGQHDMEYFVNRMGPLLAMKMARFRPKTVQFYEPLKKKPKHFTNNIFKAASEGDIPSINYLLSNNKANMRDRDSHGFNILHMAVSYKQLEVVKYLIQQKGMWANSMNSYDQTPMHLACYYGSLDIVKYLYEICMANPEAQDHDGNTPLHIACQWNQLEIVKYLIGYAKVIPYPYNDKGQSPASIIIEKGYISLGVYFYQILSRKNKNDLIATKEFRAIAEYLKKIKV